MANTKITTNVIADDAITTAKIADDVALGGNPTTTIQSAGNSTTRIATTAFVTTAIAAISTSSAADDISTGDAAVTIGTSSGAITLDTPSAIKLDADGGEIQFLDGGTEIGVVSMGSQNMNIESKVADKDIVFKGIDGSSDLTALTLDMSDAGRALFNGGIRLSGLNGGTGLAFDLAGSTDFVMKESSTNDVFQIGALYHNISSNALGIGTASPSSLLHLDGTTSNTYLTVEANSGASNAIKFVGANTWTLGNDTAAGVGDNNFALLDGSDVRITVDASGNVGINTTSFISDAVLTVDGGDMMVHGANNSAGVSDLLSGYTRGDYGVFYSSANTIYFRIASSYVSYIASNGTYNVSDERLKENVATLTGTLDKVKQLRGVSHTWKDTEEKGTDTVIGMIAQEVETVYPELVGDGGLPNDNAGNAPYKSINYAHLTSVLVEAVKELSTKLEAAEARIKTLEDA